MRTAIILLLVVALASGVAVGAAESSAGADSGAAEGGSAGVQVAPEASGNEIPASEAAGTDVSPIEAAPGEQPGDEASGDDAPAVLTLYVREFRFDGNTVVSDEELRELLAPMSGRHLTLNDLHLAAAAVALHYRSLGYFAAETFLPPQEIIDDAVTILIYEGRYDRLVIDNRSSLRDGVARPAFSWLKTDTLIESGPYERATLLLAEIPGVEASTRLAPGSREGTANLVVLLQDGTPAAGQLALESRSLANGSSRFSASLSLVVNNPSGRGDQINALVSTGGTSTGSRVEQGRVEYALPVGAGGKVGLGYSGARQSIPDALEVLDISVSSHVTSLSAQYAAIRTQQSSLSLLARLEQSLAGRSINGYETFEGRRTRLSAGIEGRRRWDFARGIGLNEYAVNTTFAARSSGEAELFHKLNGSFTQRLWWAGAGELVGSLQGQWAFTNLESGEKMELRPSGHAAGVSGDLGWIGQIEARKSWPRLWTLPGQWQGFLRLDMGSVQLERFPAGEAPEIERRYGAGAGLTWVLPRGNQLSVELGWPLQPAAGDAGRAGELALRYGFSF